MVSKSCIVDLWRCTTFGTRHETFGLKEISLSEKAFGIVERALTPILAVSSWSDFEKFLHLSNNDKNSVIINEVLWEFIETTEEKVMNAVPSKWTFNRLTIKLFFKYVSKVYIHRRIIDGVLESFGLYTKRLQHKSIERMRSTCAQLIDEGFAE